MTNLSRATALKVAATLSLLLGIIGIVLSLPFLFEGGGPTGQMPAAPPIFVIIVGFGFSVVRVVAAYGTWQNQRWAIILTVLANAIDGLITLPGVFFAPTAFGQTTATLSVIFSVVIIALCLWRDRRLATN